MSSTLRLVAGRTMMVAGFTILAESCAPSLLTLPTGLGSEANIVDGTDYLAPLATCNMIGTLTADVSIDGTVGAHHLQTRMWVGTAGSRSLRLQSQRTASLPFIFAANRGTGLLLASWGNWVVRDESGPLLEAITGLPLNVEELSSVLTGCTSVGGNLHVRQFGRSWLKISIGEDDLAELYLHRVNPRAQWNLVSVIRPAAAQTLRWRAEFGERWHGVPRTVRLISVERIRQHAPAFDVRLSLNRLQINAPLGAETFTLAIPESARPITLDALQRSRRQPAVPLMAER